jgi:integrase
MAEALDTIARMASGGAIAGECFPWHQLRYQHAQAIRTRLSDSVSARTGRPLSPASVSKHLAALRGVLRECWRLGLMSAEDLARAIDLEPVRGSTPLRGRVLEAHEVARLLSAADRASR